MTNELKTSAEAERRADTHAMSSHDVEIIATRAAHKALLDILEMLDINANNPDSRKRFRDTWGWINQFKDGYEQTKSRMWLAVWGSVVLGALIAFWNGLKIMAQGQNPPGGAG